MDLVERKDGSSQRHPWEVARCEFFLHLLKQNDLLGGTVKWLDVGAGDAWFARQLERLLDPDATVTCWDINYSAEDLAEAANAPGDGVVLTATRPNDKFERVLMLDVIEHIEDDQEFVEGVAGDLLADGGVLLLSVPAYQRLFSSHDRALRHCRRYSPASCRRLLEKSGLTVRLEGGLFHSLLPVRVGQVAVERVRPLDMSEGIGNWQAGKLATSVVTRALTADTRLSLAMSRRQWSLPGLSYWALAARTQQ
jgi:SAM-dependent methyltransferase